MSDVRIDFRIYEDVPLSRQSPDDIQGGVRIVVDDSVVTRFDVPERDEGFRGDFIYSLLADWLWACRKMLMHVPHLSDLYDEPSAFKFIHRDGRTHVRYFHYRNVGPAYRYDYDLRENVRTTYEEMNKRYPNYPTGTPVDTVDLVNAVLDVGERFYADIASRTFVCGTGPEAPGVLEFKKVLDTAKEEVKDYVRD